MRAIRVLTFGGIVAAESRKHWKGSQPARVRSVCTKLDEKLTQHSVFCAQHYDSVQSLN